MKLNRILAGLALAVCLCGAANAATLLPNGKQQFLSSNGAPLAGGTIQFYIPGTTTPKDTWQDAGQTILNTNPVVLDAAGRATIFGLGAYRQIVRDSAGNLIWDQLSADTSASTGSWAGVSGGSSNSQTVTATNFSAVDGQTIDFIAGFTNTGALTVNPNGTGALNVLNDTPTGAVSLSGGEVVAGNVVHLVYSSASGAFHTSLTSSSIPTGTVMEYAGTAAPTGFVMAYGQCISRTTFSRLFSVVGTSFGACDGSTTFAVPDRRGRVATGKDNMGGVDAGRLTSSTMDTARLVLGGTGGEARHTLTIAEMPVITPTGTVTVTFPALSYGQAVIASAGSGSGTAFAAVGTAYQLTQTAVTVAGGAGGPVSFPLSVAPFGSGTPHNVVPPAITMNFIIKL
jgi:microcystin-dependent protein